MPFDPKTYGATPLTVPSRAGRSGYLLKQGVGNRAWKSRWFVLPGRDQLLLYYEDSRNSIVPKRIVRVVGPVAARPEAVELNGHAGYAFDVWAVLPKEGSTDAGASQHALLLLLALLGESSADQPCPFTESEACSFACSLENIRSGCLLSGQPCIWCSTLTTQERC